MSARGDRALFDRPKDWVDIDTMLEAGTIDTDDALAWVRSLLGEQSGSCQRLQAAIARAGEPQGDPGVWARVRRHAGTEPTADERRNAL